MECPGEDLERLNFLRLSQGRAREFSPRSACWIEMFSGCVATAPAQGASIFRPLSLHQRGVSAVTEECVQPGQRLTDTYDQPPLNHCLHTPYSVFHFVIKKNVKDTCEISYHFVKNLREIQITLSTEMHCHF